MKIDDLPDDVGELSAWLEREMMGVKLGELIADLAATAPAETAARALPEAVPAAAVDEVCRRGLAVLSLDQMLSLLNSPLALCELQERVLERGGAYWEQAAERHKPSAELENCWAALRPRLLAAGTVPSDPSPTSPGRLAQAMEPTRTARRVAMLLTVAATLAVMALWLNRPQANSVALKLRDPAWFKANVQGDRAYLDRFADAFDAANDTSALTRRDLEQRLDAVCEFCREIIDRSHPLAPKAEAWLKNKCETWLAEDGQLEAMRRELKAEPDGAGAADIFQQYRATLFKIAKTLRDPSANGLKA